MDYTLIKSVLKSANLKILDCIRQGKNRWSDFEKVLNKRQISEALNELIQLGLIRTKKQRRGLQEYNIYELTEAGKEVVKILEELEDKIKKASSRSYNKYT